MSNVFVTLPVPSQDGVGAWVDVSTQAPERTLSVDGGAFDGMIYLEASNDGQASAAPAAVGPFTGPTQSPQTFTQGLNFMRVRRVGSSGIGTPTVNLAAPAAAANAFGAMNVPNGDGIGTAIDLSAGGDVNTFQVAGPFTGQILIETSTDGVHFSPTLLFQMANGVGQTVQGVLSAARVKRRGSSVGSLPLVSAGSQATAGGGGSGFPGYGAAPPAIAAAGAAGASALVSRADHTHAGTPSVNGAAGAATFASAGGTVAISGAAPALNLEVATPFGGLGGAPPNIADQDAAGVATTASRSDHTHAIASLFPLIDTGGSGNDSIALNAAIAAQAARGKGVVYIPGGTHRLKSTVVCLPGVSLVGAGRDSTTLLADDSGGNFGHVLSLTNPYEITLTDFLIDAVAPRTAGSAIQILGGNPADQLAAFPLSAAETSIHRVNMRRQFDGCVSLNNGAVKNWLLYIDEGKWWDFNGGTGLEIDCPPSVFGDDDYGASHFAKRLFIYNNASPVGTAINVKNTGDFNISECETWGMATGLLINPPAAGRVTTGRFNRCYFDSTGTSTAIVQPIPPTAGQLSAFGDLSFNGCWFAGATNGNGLTLNGACVANVRVVDSFFFANSQWGIVLTGGGTGCKNIMIDGCQFAGNTLGGVHAIQATHFAVRNSLFTQGTAFDTFGTQVTGVQVDLGCDYYNVSGNDWHDSTGTPFVDNGGAVNKIVTPNLS